MLNRLERQCINWTIPGLIRYLALLFVGVFLLTAINPAFAETLDFNYEKVQNGEYWRLLTFIFAPQIGSLSLIAVLFLVFGTMLMFVFSDGLEEQWGAFRANLFVYWGILSTLTANLLFASAFGLHYGMSGIYLGASILFAFATYNPRYTIMLFMVLPCPIWIIASLTGAGLILSNLRNPYQTLFVLICISNYLVVAIPMLITNSKRRGSARIRRRKFSREFSDKQEAFHTCSTCGANDITHPDKEFRVAKDGNDYCEEHLPKS